MNWQPIQPPTESDASIYVGDLESMRQAFDIRRAAALEHGHDVAVALERHKRELAIETGLLERLYSIDRGTTTLLIEHGLIAENVKRANVDIAPEHLIAILHAQRDAIEIVYDWVSQSRPLTLSGVKELHQVLTQHQEGVEGLDKFGRSATVPLLRGEWKRQPNSPLTAGGVVHGYCPPEQVGPEMDRLIAMNADAAKTLHPIVRGCWLHHRFTQIHPFQDGNGRVARCLLNYVLIEAGYLPVVVANDDRTAYLDALEAADAGELEPLVRFVCQVHARKLVQLLTDMTAPTRRATGRVTAIDAAEALATALSGTPAHENLEYAGAAAENFFYDLFECVLEPLEQSIDRLNATFAARSMTLPLSIESVQPHAEEIWQSLGRSDSPDDWDRDPVWGAWDQVTRRLAQIGYTQIQPRSTGWELGRILFQQPSLEHVQVLAFDCCPASHERWERRPSRTEEPKAYKAWLAEHDAAEMTDPWIIVATAVVHGRISLAVPEVVLCTLSEPTERVANRFLPFAERALAGFLQAIAAGGPRRGGPSNGTVQDL